jgi:dihydroflavonol-4-reductase
MNEKILITGGSGLLGSYLIRWFRQEGYINITSTYHRTTDSIPNDIRQGINWQQLVLPDSVAAMEIVKGHDWVIHAAGLVSYHTGDKYNLLDINKTGTEEIVNACLLHDVKHLVYIGSIGALGQETDHVTLNESSPWFQTAYSTGYGLSKYLGELEVWRGAGEGLNVSVILPSVILGAGDWQKSSLQILDRIVHKLPFYPGGQTGYVDVRDIASFVGLLLGKNMPGDRWLLNGKSMRYKEVYEKLANHLGVQRNFRLAPKWLAKVIILSGSFLKGKTMGLDIINQVYGTFTYDASKSRTLDGFRYRDMDVTLKEVADAYRKEGGEPVLSFSRSD